MVSSLRKGVSLLIVLAAMLAAPGAAAQSGPGRPRADVDVSAAEFMLNVGMKVKDVAAYFGVSPSFPGSVSGRGAHRVPFSPGCCSSLLPRGFQLLVEPLWRAAAMLPTLCIDCPGQAVLTIVRRPHHWRLAVAAVPTTHCRSCC